MHSSRQGSSVEPSSPGSGVDEPDGREVLTYAVVLTWDLRVIYLYIDKFGLEVLSVSVRQHSETSEKHLVSVTCLGKTWLCHNKAIVLQVHCVKCLAGPLTCNKNTVPQ